MVQIFLAFVALICAVFVQGNEIEGFDLPILPSSFLPFNYNVTTPSDKFIPRNVFIAVRKVDVIDKHILQFMNINPSWHFNLCDNDCKDAFMNTVFKNTSILWAYNILNPAIGTSKVEIWRLAVLFIYGGLYIDDDSIIWDPLDKVVEIGDKFIVGKEGYDYDDRCYVNEYSISNHSLNIRFGEKNNERLFGGKFFLNWILFSAPGSPIILRTFEHIVQLIKAEYLCTSLIKMSKSDHRGKLLMCATTYPITLSCRELVLENFPDLGLRVAGEWFKEYHAVMKVWYSDFLPDHWVRMIHHVKVPYLAEYRHPILEKVKSGEAEGSLVQAVGDRQVYIVMNHTKRGFPDLNTFMSMKLDFSNVTILPGNVVRDIPTGPTLPSSSGRKLRQVLF